ncbi:MAG: RNA polymerase sigma factor, partial [Gemmatimonadaceae bacterium]
MKPAQSEVAEHAFVSFVERHKPAVFRWAVALAGDVDDAEDITQEVFVRAYHKLDTFRGDGAVEGWLYRITRRLVSGQRTRAARRARLGALPAAQPDNDVYLTDPGARVDRERTIALIREMVDTLPLRQREVFVLCDLQGRTPAEVAFMLGMKDVSVRASLFKARAAVRRS